MVSFIVYHFVSGHLGVLKDVECLPRVFLFSVVDIDDAVLTSPLELSS